jgi:hypothetical protein
MEKLDTSIQRLVNLGFNPTWQGPNGTGSSSSTATGYQNGTGATTLIGTPVAQGTGANFILLDVTNETSVEAYIGLATAAIPASTTGQIASDGRVQNIDASFGLTVGDPVYAGLTPGSLTNTKPDLTVSGWTVGMFVIFIGVVVQNQFNPSNQDIQIFKQIVGQL